MERGTHLFYVCPVGSYGSGKASETEPSQVLSEAGFNLLYFNLNFHHI
jgi:hypothetical protein